MIEMKREDCDCELCENMRAFYDTTAKDWNWTYCPNFERMKSDMKVIFG